MTGAFNEDEETADAVISQARASGAEISREQLERWHRAGALPSPRQQPLGPSGGSVTLYPIGTSGQAVAIAQGLTKTRRLDQVAFPLWLSGLPVAMPLVRRYLERVARWHDRLAFQARAAGFGEPELPDEALDIVERIARKHADGPLPGVWERLGSRGDRETLLRIFLDALAGRYVPTSSPSDSIRRRESEGLLVERAIGIGNGRTEPLLEVGPWLKGDPDAMLAGIPELLAGDWMGALREASDDALIAARQTLKDFREVVVGLGEAFEMFFGHGAFGLTALAPTLRGSTPFDDGFLLFAMLRARANPDLSPKLEVLTGALPDLRELVALTGTVHELRDRPDVGDLFAPDVLRAAFADPAALEAHTRTVQDRVAVADQDP